MKVVERMQEGINDQCLDFADAATSNNSTNPTVLPYVYMYACMYPRGYKKK